MNESPTTGVRKRQQITNTNKQMMIYVAAAAAIITVCTMLALNFWQHISYQMRVNTEWGITNNNLKESINNIPTLRNNVEALSANTNIKSIQGLVDSKLKKWQVVFDVLPSSCDSMAVEYSFMHIIFKPSQLGAGIKDTAASTDGIDCDAIAAAAAGAARPQPVVMRVSFELVNATDADIGKALLSIEYSLQPITIQFIEINSNDDNIRSVKITAQIYFMPKSGWQWTEKTVPVEEDATTAEDEEATQ